MGFSIHCDPSQKSGQLFQKSAGRSTSVHERQGARTAFVERGHGDAAPQPATVRAHLLGEANTGLRALGTVGQKAGREGKGGVRSGGDRGEREEAPQATRRSLYGPGAVLPPKLESHGPVVLSWFCCGQRRRGQAPGSTGQGPWSFTLPAAGGQGRWMDGLQPGDRAGHRAAPQGPS